MNIIDKTESTAAVDFERYRLRRFLAELPTEEIENYLKRHKREAAPSKRKKKK